MYGKRIKEKRKLFGLTRKQLATRICTAPLNIKLWEEEQIEPTIADLIIMASEFNTTIDWLVGVEEDCDEEYVCEDCKEFIDCKVTPHMEYYINKHKSDDPAYMHIQLTMDGGDDDCVLYSGKTAALLSCVNMMLDSLSEECSINYYDIVAMLASAHASSELGELFGE